MNKLERKNVQPTTHRRVAREQLDLLVQSHLDRVGVGKRDGRAGSGGRGGGDAGEDRVERGGGGRRARDGGRLGGGAGGQRVGGRGVQRRCGGGARCGGGVAGGDGVGERGLGGRARGGGLVLEEVAQGLSGEKGVVEVESELKKEKSVRRHRNSRSLSFRPQFTRSALLQSFDFPLLWIC